MRKEYRKALNNQFSSHMKKENPRFEEIKVKSLYFQPGDTAFCWQVTLELHCWIVLNPSPKGHNEFTVLIGWSKQGRYPQLSMVPCLNRPTHKRDEFKEHEYLTRLPYLWTDEDKWWVVKKFKTARTVADLQAELVPIPPAEAEQVVEPLVKDAMKKIADFAIPYLDEFAKIND